MLKLGYTLSNLVIICLQKLKNHKFYPFFQGDRDLCEKIREGMTLRPSIVFTPKAVVDQSYIRNSSNVCNTIVGIDARQLYSFSICQEMPTGFYTRWGYESENDRSRLERTKTESLRLWLCLFIKNKDRTVKLRVYKQRESSYQETSPS